MWIVSREGFISVVQHKDDPSKFRVRARRLEHLLSTFAQFTSLDVIDFGPNASDYRYHLDVDREVLAAEMLSMLNDIDYESHAKEAMAGDDQDMHWALMGCWRELHKLQR
jgi:hypothetical protein